MACQSDILAEVLDFGDGLVVQVLIADHPAFGDFFAWQFKLRFDQGNNMALGAKKGEQGGKEFGQRDEG